MLTMFGEQSSAICGEQSSAIFKKLLHRNLYTAQNIKALLGFSKKKKKKSNFSCKGKRSQNLSRSKAKLYFEKLDLKEIRI